MFDDMGDKMYDCEDLIVTLDKKSKVGDVVKNDIIYTFECKQIMYRYGLTFDLDNSCQKDNCHRFQELGGGALSMNLNVQILN